MSELTIRHSTGPVATDTPVTTGPAGAGDLADLTATELLAAFAAGTATPSQAVEACLARIAAVNPRINAVVRLAPGAVEAAMRADTALRRGDR
ncbi:MAG TPA: hypothetical protein VD813_15050, partial [Pseudonocardia sp.]|nr:hypothetical protein [Pseudonocardia sp.]